MVRTVALSILLMGSLASHSMLASELVQLTPENWGDYAPRGKEVDAIYNDFVLKNDRITVVVAQPLPTRHANLTVHNVAAAIIDLTHNQGSNDQLSAYYPLAAAYPFGSATATYASDGASVKSLPARGKTVALQFELPAGNGRPAVTLTYRLQDGQPYVVVTTTLKNSLDKPITVTTNDSIRADRTFKTGIDPETHLFWAYDEWFRASYGVVVPDHKLAQGSRGVIQILPQDGQPKRTLAAGESLTITRKIFPSWQLYQTRAIARRQSKLPVTRAAIVVTDADGPVANAKVSALQGDKVYAWGRTAKTGRLDAPLAPGKYTIRVEALGRPAVTQEWQVSSEKGATLKVAMEPCGRAHVVVTDGQGQALPAKIAFHGINGTETPFFGPDSRPERVHNLCYTAHGEVTTELAPGEYDVVISHGPEYDAAVEKLRVERGKTAELKATLRRVVDSKGWVSSDFHSHSSPSGDNTTSQRGRVLNLLCEHVEFAPCTEHNRVSSYVPHLKALKALHLMATCPGIELTGKPLPVNHQNAFPLVLRRHHQDGGGPQIDADPVKQIRRLAMWDNGAEKLVQQNHPDLQQIYGDRDLDGTPDEGFREMLGVMDVVEVHPPAQILSDPKAPPSNRNDRRPIIRWLQLLNLGYRIPGVVNTDAHYTFHGSGWLRNYIASSTDDPAEIDTMEMVAAAKAGHVIMSTGPFMTVVLESGEGEHPRGIPGDDVTAPSGKAVLRVEVQCANWLDVNRVQVLLNGRQAPDLNFTRRKESDGFGNGVMKFAATIPLTMSEDTHIIVAAAGEGLDMVRVMGPQYGTNIPIAVSNPIFVDVDGNGFKPNGDLLGLPLIGTQR